MRLNASVRFMLFALLLAPMLLLPGAASTRLAAAFLPGGAVDAGGRSGDAGSSRRGTQVGARSSESNQASGMLLERPDQKGRPLLAGGDPALLPQSGGLVLPARASAAAVSSDTSSDTSHGPAGFRSRAPPIAS
ncbi:hypothetical protein [Mangrovicella endophytica]|uniref:hypothetical protein n=1 Tax=Mangrovicella endophytica TaxID=2066697 RepID=UPI000C9E43BD|nr:hypothetical protein [Mangrovicella endophytica]